MNDEMGCKKSNTKSTKSNEVEATEIMVVE